MHKPVLLVTVMDQDGTAPIAHGIYENTVQVLNSLGNMGMHPGFDCAAKSLFNGDGSQAGMLFGSGRYVATVSAMPLSMAAAIAKGQVTWDVPDTPEGIE